MNEYDSGRGYHPSEREVAKKPKWISFNRDMFTVGSVGYAIFPQALEGRNRPDTTLNQPLASLFTSRSTAFQELKSCGLITVSDVLNLPYENLSSLSREPSIRDFLQNYMDGLLILPHGKLLQAIFGEAQSPVNAQREQELIDTVELCVPGGAINEKYYHVLALRFGLEDGITRTLDETFREVNDLYQDYNIGRERARQLEAKALRKLLHPSKSKHLKPYLTFSEKSFARQVLGFTFNRDIPEGLNKVGVLDFELSDSVQKELEALGHSGMLYGNCVLFATGINVDKLSPQAIEELKEGFQSLSPERIEEIKKEKIQRLMQKLDEAEKRHNDDTGYDDEFDEWEEESELGEDVRSHAVDVFVAPETERTEPVRSVVNNLLPEIDLSEEELQELGEKTISEFKPSYRLSNQLRIAGIESLADLLSLNRGDIPGIRNVGKKMTKELGEMLEKVLDLPAEKYPKGFISALLTSAFQPDQQEKVQEAGFPKSKAQRQLEGQMRQREIRGEKNQQLFLETAGVVERAQAEGCKTLDDIRYWMEMNNVNIPGERHPDGLKTRALIFYVLNHSEEGEKPTQ